MTRRHMSKTLLLLLVVLLWPLHGITCAVDKLTGTTDMDYQPNPSALESLKKITQPVEIVLFYGSWCPDSQREVPRFMRVLELVDNSKITLTEYEVNRKKQDLAGKAEEYGIRFVPTFIVMWNGTELGRIVEVPEMSLEEDLALILTQKLSGPGVKEGLNH